MLDVLSDTYRIATRTDAFEAPRIDAPVRNRPRIVRPDTVPRTRTMPPRKPQRAAGLMHAVRWIARRLGQWQERRQAREYALRMSEHQLRDIGLRREELLRGINNSR